MTVIEHLTELRRRVIIILVGFLFAAALAYWFAPDIIRFFLHYYKDVTHGKKNSFIFTGPLDAFLTRLKVATYAGLILSFPVVLWELWRFITPGLHKREKKYAIPFIISSIILFAIGAVVALLTLEPELKFLLSIGGSDLQPLLTADKYISLVSLMILAFGLSFEFPVILVFLLIAHVLTTRQLRSWRRYAIVTIVAFAAIITPSQDPYSLFAMAIPMYIFYEASIIIGRVLKR